MSVVVSVNVGQPRDVEWQGRIVRTAIWKRPVQGRIVAGRLNLAGDAQADLLGHGGEQRAVMVYQLDSYRHWGSVLGRADLVYGTFGENLTVNGMEDSKVCIGDRFRIGSGIFEVSQPRVTCYKVGLRLGRPEMPALMVSHRRPGFYLRVVKEGEVGAGDQIEKIADGPEQMTVADINALLYTQARPVEALRRALRIPGLSPGWQESVRALLRAAEEGDGRGNDGVSPAPAVSGGWRGFRPLKIVAAARESEDVRSLEFAAAEGGHLPEALPGQHIVIRMHPSAAQPPVVRNYSLCGPPSAETYRIAVKDVGGAGSAFLHERAQLGDLLDVSAPRGSFTLAPGKAPIVLLSAGVGITPLLAMLHATVASDKASPRETWWVHSARNGAHHSFASRARRLVSSLRNGHICNIYSRPGAADHLGLDYDVQGHLTGSVLRQLGVPRDAEFYLCGPAGYLAEVQAILHTRGIEESHVHAEVFGPAAPLAPGVIGGTCRGSKARVVARGTGPLITFVRSGIVVRWDDRFSNLLELAEAYSIPVRWSCRAGVCHNCESGVVDGQLRYSAEPLDAPADGMALICCAIPISDVELDL